MTVYEMQQKILELKDQKDICILAHSYQNHDITEIADFTGDSFQLSVKATSAPQSTVLMCGVRFMAETVKLLSPKKRVILAAPSAGCPMAEQMSRKFIESEKAKNPNCTVVAYINTTAELKTVCDVCVTSSSALKIVNGLENKDILFIPDCNLGSFVAKNCPDKNIKLLNGGCPIHASVTADEVVAARAAHPNAEVLVHPECIPQVTEQADYAGSTAGIMDYAVKSDKKEFIIGTELSIVEHLSYMCPDKKFYPLSKKLICSDMKLTNLVDVYNALVGIGGEEIELDAETMQKARVCIDRMVELG